MDLRHITTQGFGIQLFLHLGYGNSCVDLWIWVEEYIFSFKRRKGI